MSCSSKTNTYTDKKKNPAHPLNIWANELNRWLSKEEMKMASKYLKKYSLIFKGKVKQPPGFL